MPSFSFRQERYHATAVESNRYFGSKTFIDFSICYCGPTPGPVLGFFSVKLLNRVTGSNNCGYYRSLGKSTFNEPAPALKSLDILLLLNRSQRKAFRSIELCLE